ncbi:hypothetical protein, partial [Burkholderia stagnalis]|uniref:hypothetical protein n=1 Tax=Burkholderia stagnalis TaxID=1503054 RepID=UPI001C2E2C18
PRDPACAASCEPVVVRRTGPIMAAFTHLNPQAAPARRSAATSSATRMTATTIAAIVATSIAVTITTTDRDAGVAG